MRTRTRWAIGLVVVAALLACLPATAVAKKQPKKYPTAMLFVSGGAVWRTKADGTGRTKLTSAATGATAWSTNHNWIAYIHKGKKGAVTVWTMWSNGTHRKQVKYSKPWKGWKYGRVDESSLTWSHSGRYIAYADTLPARPGHMERDYIVIIDLEKHKGRKLTKTFSEGEHVWGLRYMPDGKHLLEWEDVAAAGVMRLIAVSNGHSSDLIDGGDSITDADVSRDGTKLVCTMMNIDTGNFQLKTMAIDGSNQTILEDHSLDYDTYEPSGCRWSPAGTQIIYGLYNWDTDLMTAVLANADGSNPTYFGSDVPTSWR